MDNYYDTANRMYKSAKTLHDNAEFHNACYLAGYVIESYAKIIVGISNGLDYKKIAKDFKHDLDKLDNELQYILNNSAFTSYIVDMRNEFSFLLSGNKMWNPLKRYSEDSQKWKQTDSINFQNQIQLAMQKIAKLKNDGYNLI